MPSTPTALGHEVATRFALGSMISIELGGTGAMGRIWRLRTTEADVAVKQLFWSSDAVALEPFALREAAFATAGRLAGVLAPRDHTDRRGRLAVSTAGGTVRVADWVPGTPVAVGDPVAAEWAGWVMATLTGLSFGTEADEIDPWYTVPPTEEHWLTLTGAGQRAGAPWADELARQVPDLLNLGDLVGRPERRTVWCHTDIQAQNAVRRVDGRYELIDWDDAGPVDPVFALARLLVDWCVDPGGLVHRDRVAAVLAGFRRGGGVLVPTTVDDFGGLVAGTLNFLAGQVELALDLGVPGETRGDDLRAVGTRQVQRLLAAPLRRSTLLDVLAAVSAT